MDSKTIREMRDKIKSNYRDKITVEEWLHPRYPFKLKFGESILEQAMKILRFTREALNASIPAPRIKLEHGTPIVREPSNHWIPFEKKEETQKNHVCCR